MPTVAGVPITERRKFEVQDEGEGVGVMRAVEVAIREVVRVVVRVVFDVR